MTTTRSIADQIPEWFEGGTVEQMRDEAFAQIRKLEAEKATVLTALYAAISALAEADPVGAARWLKENGHG